ncbi:MAG: hypothetical protein V3S39_10210 [Thermodesulfobacteriota bacterium]
MFYFSIATLVTRAISNKIMAREWGVSLPAGITIDSAEVVNDVD